MVACSFGGEKERGVAGELRASTSKLKANSKVIVDYLISDWSKLKLQLKLRTGKGKETERNKEC